MSGLVANCARGDQHAQKGQFHRNTIRITDQHVEAYSSASGKWRNQLLLPGAWGWLIVIIGAYFLYYLSDMAENLWARGMWFTENDVLHIGLIVWMVYITAAVARNVKDERISAL